MKPLYSVSSDWLQPDSGNFMMLKYMMWPNGFVRPGDGRAEGFTRGDPGNKNNEELTSPVIGFQMLVDLDWILL